MIDHCPALTSPVPVTVASSAPVYCPTSQRPCPDRPFHLLNSLSRPPHGRFRHARTIAGVLKLAVRDGFTTSPSRSPIPPSAQSPKCTLQSSQGFSRFIHTLPIDPLLQTSHATGAIYSGSLASCAFSKPPNSYSYPIIGPIPLLHYIPNSLTALAASTVTPYQLLSYVPAPH